MEDAHSTDADRIFALRGMAKDLAHALGEAAARKVSLETAAAALSLFQHASKKATAMKTFPQSAKPHQEFLNPEQQRGR